MECAEGRYMLRQVAPAKITDGFEGRGCFRSQLRDVQSRNNVVENEGNGIVMVPKPFLIGP